MIKKYLSFAILLKTWAAYAAVPVIKDTPQILSYVDKKLLHKGTLKETETGLLYIELPQEYVFEILPLIAESEVSPPPYFSPDKVGAHITVATQEEIAGLNFPMIPYLGEQIPFSIEHLCEVDLENSMLGSGKIYIFTIDSPKIAEIRNRLGLPPKIKGYDFHITVGLKLNLA